MDVMILRVVLLLATALPLACTPPDAGEGEGEGEDEEVVGPASRDVVYNDACAVDGNCVVVVYATCAPCSTCGDIAINAAEEDRFDDDNVITGCPEPEPVFCGPCDDLRAVCADGRCVVENCSEVDCG